MRSRLSIPILILVVLVAACGGTADSPPSEAEATPFSATETTGVPSPAEQSEEAAEGGIDLSAGACLIEEMVEYQGEEKPALTANIDCSEPHAAEVVAIVTGDSFLKARTACKELAEAEYPDIPQERFYVMGPSVRGGSEYSCLYGSAGESGSLLVP